MIHRFRSLIKSAHSVVTYSQASREYLVGIVDGDYRFEPSQQYNHVRHVNWTGTVARDILGVSTRNSLGSIATLFSIPDDAADRALSFMDAMPGWARNSGYFRAGVPVRGRFLRSGNRTDCCPTPVCRRSCEASPA